MDGGIGALQAKSLFEGLTLCHLYVNARGRWDDSTMAQDF